jgi:ATP-dependent Clp protease ATP-binding subunit ClpA
MIESTGIIRELIMNTFRCFTVSLLRSPPCIYFAHMFERYTEPSRRVIFYSRYMAAQAGSRQIETEHLLLGLLRGDMVLARRFLGSPWAAEEIWREVERRKSVLAAIPAGVDLPLSPESKRVLLLAEEEADLLSSNKIRTEHLLLGLLRDEGDFAAALLSGRGVHLAATRAELRRNPHDDSMVEEFVREPNVLPEGIAESRDRLRSIVTRMEQAIANRDFTTARSCSDEERIERNKLRSLYQEHGMSGWMFE